MYIYARGMFNAHLKVYCTICISFLSLSFFWTFPHHLFLSLYSMELDETGFVRGFQFPTILYFARRVLRLPTPL
jgi:hypothetical protein